MSQPGPLWAGFRSAIGCLLFSETTGWVNKCGDSARIGYRVA